MSIIMSTPEQIHNGPVNSSTAKNLWTFPKEERFNWKSRDNNASPNRFYNLPNIFDKRSTSFGYGTKSNFTQSGRNTPPPNAYNLKTSMDFGIMKRKGYTFGLSRNQIVTNQASPEKTPGPGSYKAKSGLDGAKYSMGARITSSHDNLRSGSPGPGSYRTLDGTNPKGSYFYSKFKNSGAGKFSPSTSPRFNNHSPGREYPGPGAYVAKASLNETGFYFDSKFHSSGARTFGAGSRDNLYASAGGLPGPGYYRLPSEFGYYESAKAHPDMKPFVKVGSVRNRKKKFY